MTNLKELFKPPYYVLHDFDERLKEQGTFEVTTYSKAKYLNSIGYAVFSLVNDFTDPIRVASNIKRHNYFYVDTDAIPKKEVIRKLKLVCKPTYLIETKRGYHIYYAIEENIVEDIGIEKAVKFYDNFNRKRLIPFFKGDKQVFDTPRILRTPGFYHWKKYPSWNEYQEPFLIKKSLDTGIRYSIKELQMQFSEVALEQDKKKFRREALNLDSETFLDSDSIFQRFNCLSALDVLKKLSGEVCVNKEQFSFRPITKGYQVLVNGNSVRSWIDTEGKIGGGSHTNTGWLSWYQKNVFNYPNIDWKEIYGIIVKYFPEMN